MSGLLENAQIVCAVCRIGAYTVWQKLCCRKPPVPRPELDVVCIGLDGAGKTTLLTLLSGETLEEETKPTTGFQIKALPFKTCIMNVKEIGGGEKVRKFWKHYYQGTQAVIFVLDSACDAEKLEQTQETLHEAMEHPQLQGTPCLILANCQDKENARLENNLTEELSVDKACKGRWWHLHLCSKSELDTVRAGFDHLSRHMLRPNGEEDVVPQPTEKEINRV